MLPRLSRLSKRDDRGESLIELLVALTVMATAIVALLGALATAIRISELHRHQSEAGAYIKEFAETLERKAAETPTGYLECAPASYYQSFYPKPPAPYDREVVTVRYWDGDSFEPTCAAGDDGVQLLSLRVWSDVPGRPSVVETLDITLRSPCRPGETPACD